MAPEYESILTVVGIYADQLHDILEDMTGLVVRKPRVTFA